MKKSRSERKGGRHFDTAAHYNALGMIAREKPQTAEAAVGATDFRPRQTQVIETPSSRLLDDRGVGDDVGGERVGFMHRRGG